MSLFRALRLGLKIKKPEIVINILDAGLNPDKYNLAELLSFDSVKIISDAIDFCIKKRIPVGSTAIFYSAVKSSKDINLICLRLGINPKKLRADLKNYLEKMQLQHLRMIYLMMKKSKKLQNLGEIAIVFY